MSHPSSSPVTGPPTGQSADQSEKATASFTARIARSFLLLAILTVSLVGSVAYICGRLALKDAAYNRLEMTATLKQKEIVRWLESCEEDFLLIATFPTVTRDVQTLLSLPAESADYQAAERRVRAYFAEIQQTKPKFTEISIQNRANQIILSTNPDKEGKYEMSANLTELDSLVSGEEFAPNFYRSPTTRRPAITYASKIYDDTGDQRQGMILANLNLKRIDDIISERTGLDKTGETYLVGSLANEHAFLSRRDTLLPPAQGPQSDGIQAAFNGHDGKGTYDNYAGQPVIGVYRWLAGQDIALLAEMGKEEAFGPARSLAVTIALVGVGSAGILLFGVARLARQLSSSRQQIESYSRQLEKTAAEANTANQAKSDFLANMSHELRTPLNAILGFTQLMQRDRLAALSTAQPQTGPQTGPQTEHAPNSASRQYEYLGIISRSGEHLLNLINDVLSMSKIEAGRTTLDSVCFDLRYLLLTLEEMLQMRAEGKAIQLYVEVEQTVPQFIKTDEVKLRQVLVNLVGNAIKFTQSGRVILSVKEDDLTIFFSIQDTGPGISADELPHLFDPFFQSVNTRTMQQGTGLGLAISQRFVNMMGGKIAVETVPNQGSTFSFSIQAQLADPAELPSAPLGEVVGIAPNQPVYRILVVEDVFSARQLMVALLSQVGFEVQAVTNGQEAIAAYQTWQPHLIWMDMRMPVMDGYEATQKIRGLDATAKSAVKIIAITASAFEKERTAVLASGCDDFVRKPFQTHVIFSKMAEHLGVKYCYRDDAAAGVTASADPAAAIPTAAPPTVSTVPLSPAKMAAQMNVMSSDWLSQFHQGAIAVDAEALHHLVAQIPDPYQPLAASLTHLIQNFCFDELIALTQIYA